MDLKYYSHQKFNPVYYIKFYVEYDIILILIALPHLAFGDLGTLCR